MFPFTAFFCWDLAGSVEKQATSPINEPTTQPNQPNQLPTSSISKKNNFIPLIDYFL